MFLLLSDTDAGFDVLNMPFLAAWLDSSDTSSISSTGSLVDSITDLSSNGNDAVQLTGASRPTTGSNTINGLNVITYDGSGVNLDLTSGISPSNGYTIFMVNRPAAASSARSTIIGGDSNAYALEFGSTEAIQVRRNTTSLYIGSTSFSDTTNILTFHATDNGVDGSAVHFDGVLEASNYGVNELATGNITTLGGKDLGTQPFYGDIGEVIICAGLLSTYWTNLCGQYLANKWGTTWTQVNGSFSTDFSDDFDV